MKKKLPWALKIYLWFIILMHIIAIPKLLVPEIRLGEIALFLLLIIGFISVQFLKNWARVLLIVSCMAAILNCLGGYFLRYSFSGGLFSVIFLEFALIVLLIFVYYAVPISIFRMENIRKLFK